MHKIIFRSPAKKFIKKLDKKEQDNVLNKIEFLKKDPKIGKPLSGNLRGLWRLRYDKYRIIYKIREQEFIVVVLNIGHRKDIYT